MRLSLFKHRTRLIFIFSPRYQYSGSTVMRGNQLANIVKTYYGHDMAVKVQPLSTRFTGDILVLTKGAVTDVTYEQLDELVQRGNTVLLDPVDNPLDIDKAKRASGVLAASRQADKAYRDAGVTTFLVNHHVDVRIPRDRPADSDELRIGYFGELVNTIITPALQSHVDFIHVDTGKQSNEWLERLRHYNMHYAVRSNNVEAFKPFLKGFTAAACHANIIIQKDQKEAVEWLGGDYPYLLDGKPTEHQILDMLQYVEESYRSPEWNRGLERMAAIREAVSDRRVAEQLIQAITNLRS